MGYDPKGGILRCFCTYTSEPRHTSVQYPGENALQKAAQAILELCKINDRLAQIKPANFEQPCMFITTMTAGTAPNVHLAKATFSIDRRLVPGDFPMRYAGD